MKIICSQKLKASSGWSGLDAGVCLTDKTTFRTVYGKTFQFIWEHERDTSIESISSRKGPPGRVWGHDPTDAPGPLWSEYKEEAS